MSLDRFLDLIAYAIVVIVSLMGCAAVVVLLWDSIHVTLFTLSVIVAGAVFVVIVSWAFNRVEDIRARKRME